MKAQPEEFITLVANQPSLLNVPFIESKLCSLKNVASLLPMHKEKVTELLALKTQQREHIFLQRVTYLGIAPEEVRALMKECAFIEDDITHCYNNPDQNYVRDELVIALHKTLSILRSESTSTKEDYASLRECTSLLGTFAMNYTKAGNVQEAHWLTQTISGLVDETASLGWNYVRDSVMGLPVQLGTCALLSFPPVRCLQVAYTTGMVLYSIYNNIDALNSDFNGLVRAIYDRKPYALGRAFAKTAFDVAQCALATKILRKSLVSLKSKKFTHYFKKAFDGGTQDCKDFKRAKPLLEELKKETCKVIEEAETIWTCPDHCATLRNKPGRKHELQLKDAQLSQQECQRLHQEINKIITEGKNATPVFSFDNLNHLFSLEVMCKTNKEGILYLDITGLHHDYRGRLQKHPDYKIVKVKDGPAGTYLANVSYKGSESKPKGMFPYDAERIQVLKWILEAYKNQTTKVDIAGNGNYVAVGKAIIKGTIVNIEIIIHPNKKGMPGITAYPLL
jgi:Bacterial EndoU nuclease